MHHEPPPAFTPLNTTNQTKPNMDNWLGFSLSQQQQHQQQQYHSHSLSDDDCFELSSAPSPLLTLPLPASVDSFTNTHSLGMNPGRYKSSTGLSMFMDKQSQEKPLKLENFLGGYISQNHASAQVVPPSDHQPTARAGDINKAGGVLQEAGSSIPNHNINNPYNTNSIGSMGGLSMMKSWLRNQTSTLLMHGNNSNVSGVGNAQTLSLSINTNTSISNSANTGKGTHYGSSLPLLGETNITNDNGDQSCSSDNNNISNTHQQDSSSMCLHGQNGAVEAASKKSIDTFGQRTSVYRGVTRHRWTGRYEAHLWDNSCRREGQTRKGRQVYLGGYDKEEKAARAYDLAALKYWGTTTTTNFPISEYEKELEEMKHMTRQEYVASLRRKSSGFSRGASIYRGVTR